MIFVTVGSQKFQFNRLLKKIDNLIFKNIITENVFAQTGTSDYIPQNYAYQPFLDREKFTSYMSNCDIVITHGGTGTIISAIKNNKKVIVVPRLSEYGEHVDNHQIQLIKQFDEMNLIYPCYNCEMLDKALINIKQNKYETYFSNTQLIINSIEKFIENKDN